MSAQLADMRALIPARSGSKSVEDKNIQIVHGHPLLAYSVAAASFIVDMENVVISTDSWHYAEIAREYGVDVQSLRPEELARDSSTDLELFDFILERELATFGSRASHWVHLRPTTPYREPDLIRFAIKMFTSENAGYSSLRSCQSIDSQILKYSLRDELGVLTSLCGDYNMDRLNAPRQSFPPAWAPNGYIDIVRSDFVRATGRLHGDRCLGFITPQVIDVDDYVLLDRLRETAPPKLLLERLSELRASG